MIKKIACVYIFFVSLFASALIHAQDAYVISPDDALEIEVYDEPDLSVMVRVSSDGQISYPLLGTLKVAGQNVSQFEDELTTLLAKDYLVDPRVKVHVKEYSNIYVLGEVVNPGPYKLTAHTTVMKAIASAGGMNEYADRNRIVLSREDGAFRRNVLINLSAASEGKLKEQDIQLKPNDVIRVKKLENYYALGEIQKPGEYVLKENLTVLEAITLAGGFTKIAAPNRTRIIRTEGNTKKTLTVHVKDILKNGNKHKDVALQPNDVILVPESLL